MNSMACQNDEEEKTFLPGGPKDSLSHRFEA